MDIIRSGNILLLCDEDLDMEDVDAELIKKLAAIWEDLFPQFSKLFNASGHDKTFNVTKEIDFLERKYDIIAMSVESLFFDRDETLVAMLREYNYRLTDENYIDDLKKILREREGIIIKINQFRSTLPKVDEAAETNDDDNEVIGVMAAYSSILGIDFDYNTVSVMKFKALEDQVKQKIKSIENANQKNRKQ